MAKSAGKTGFAVSPINGAVIPTGAHPLNTGGKPGRSGRPPSAIRARLRGSFANRVKILKEIADSEDSRGSDRLKALDLMAKYGLGEAKGYDEALVEALGESVRSVLDRELSDEVADRVWGEVRDTWVAVIGLHVRG